MPDDVGLPNREPHQYVICRICGRKFKTIEQSHLRKHGYTIKDYEREFPNAPRISTATLFKLPGRRQLKEERIQELKRE